ncbi:MAG: MogA/MoaB family molybdenum cofactor biosynthesis protein [Nitrososphaerales archaeon]
MKPHEEHRSRGKKSISISVITVSTSRYEKIKEKKPFTDESADRAEKLIKESGFNLKSRKVVDDHKGLIRLEVLKSIYEEGCDAVILTGGTGLSSRDVTVEAIRPLLDKELEGFPEIFRTESFKSVGSAAYLTRTVAGSLDGRLIFCLPGSPDAVELGLKLLLPELPHALYIAGT